MVAKKARKPTSTAAICYPLLLLLLLVLAGVPAKRCHAADGGGEWQLLHASIGISAMHMQLLPGDKVVMFDRTDFGPSNLSLAGSHCRVDPSDLALRNDCTAHSLLYDLSSNSIRPLTLLTDTWCSSAALLPNGTLLQSGGYNDGEFAIRSIEAGSSSSDWVELPGYLSVRRWYATDQLLPDGRVLILGGRRQFSYEFYPRQVPNPLFRLPFLEDTRDGNDENNLYPFVHLLPDGTLFVFANTQAILLDVAGNRVVRSLPPIPDGAPRNYPSSGSSVLLPLRPASGVATRAEVLICGGAPRSSFQHALNGIFLPASSTCGRITPTDPDPVWAMEDMPIPRVMGDMLLLPTGDAVLIINGAASGTAGWELARDPVTSPVMYRPGEPRGSRFTVLSRTNVPRLYHSAAVVDTYGRVLVGGSNPHVYYNFTNVTYPTEMSLEAFHPPYLDSALVSVQPRIVSVGGGETVAVGYGVGLAVRFMVVEYRPWAEVSVVALAPSFTTHSLAMNQRAVLLPVGPVAVVKPNTYEVEAVSPPSPEVAPPGYYLLFVVHDGVPSKGVWIKIQRTDAA